MAGSSLLVLLDDISMLLDDVAAMSKVAAGKTAGVLGDDLALNAEQVAGIRAERELPVLWAVAKGSLLNKVILVPAALTVSTFAPQAVLPLLMIGGLYLCFEGAEKVLHGVIGAQDDEDATHRQALARAMAQPEIDLVAFERDKVKGAIRTDFILSAEIVTITLGTVTQAPWLQQVLVLSGVSVLITFGVYGLVAAIVKLDDMGLSLMRRAEAAGRRGPGWHFGWHLGRGLLSTAPKLMKALSVLGTAAMFIVGGGILVHGMGPVHEQVTMVSNALEGSGQGWATPIWPICAEALLGLVCGLVAVVVVTGLGAVRKLLRQR